MYISAWTICDLDSMCHNIFWAIIGVIRDSYDLLLKPIFHHIGNVRSLIDHDSLSYNEDQHGPINHPIVYLQQQKMWGVLKLANSFKCAKLIERLFSFDYDIRFWLNSDWQRPCSLLLKILIICLSIGLVLRDGKYGVYNCIPTLYRIQTIETNEQ